jgi:hypothetical protein
METNAQFLRTMQEAAALCATFWFGFALMMANPLSYVPHWPPNEKGPAS